MAFLKDLRHYTVSKNHQLCWMFKPKMGANLLKNVARFARNVSEKRFFWRIFMYCEYLGNNFQVATPWRELLMSGFLCIGARLVTFYANDAKGNTSVFLAIFQGDASSKRDTFSIRILATRFPTKEIAREPFFKKNQTWVVLVKE